MFVGFAVDGPDGDPPVCLEEELGGTPPLSVSSSIPSETHFWWYSWWYFWFY